MLTPTEQMQVKRHLGYSTVSPSLYPLADVYLTAGQILSTLPTETETEVRTILGTLANLETQVNSTLASLKVKKLGSIETKPEGFGQVWTEIRRWRNELSVLTGLPNLRATRALAVI